MVVSRRNFLKNSLSGAALSTVVAAPVSRLIASTADTQAWTNGKQVNPDVDNTKVVCCYDTAMTASSGSAADTFEKQNQAINAEVVEKNMDVMAMRLTGKSSGAQAWATLFQKPTGKEWATTKVAVKVNCIFAQMMPHVALVGKVCKELIALGIPPKSITIYDACDNASGDGKYSPHVGNGIPADVVVSNVTKDGANVAVGQGTQKCTKVVTDCDILVNCAINKGHSQTDKGGFTLTMKNHTGTMKYSCPSLQELIDQNRCDTILGGTIPRQQLCIVDCIWSAKKGPFDSASHFTNRIVMGTFGPLVDVAVAKKIREPIMSATHTESAITTILSSFGYVVSDIKYEEFTPTANSSRHLHRAAADSGRVTVMVGNGARPASSFTFKTPVADNAQMVIRDIGGRRVRTFELGRITDNIIHWNGLTENGTPLARGNYVVSITTSAKVVSGMVSLL